MGTLANVEDTDEMLHYIRVCTICQDKINLQRKKYTILGEIITCDPSKHTMDHSDYLVCSFMETSIGPKRGNWGECGKRLDLLTLQLHCPSALAQRQAPSLSQLLGLVPSTEHRHS